MRAPILRALAAATLVFGAAAAIPAQPTPLTIRDEDGRIRVKVS